MSNSKKLDFLKRVLTDTVDEHIKKDFFNSGNFPNESVIDNVLSKKIDNARESGMDWPEKAHTMIGLLRLNNLHKCLDFVRENNLNGDVIETGVWRGGSCIFMKKYIDMYNLNKKVFVADSFEGLPKPKLEQDFGDNHYKNEYLKVSLEEVKENFKLYHCLDENVIFVKGWFEDTLKDNNIIKNLSILRMDGDMYKSTIDVFMSCYDKVIDQGFIIVDDYCLKGCVEATTDFRKIKNIKEDIVRIDDCGVFWQKNLN